MQDGDKKFVEVKRSSTTKNLESAKNFQSVSLNIHPSLEYADISQKPSGKVTKEHAKFHAG